MVNIDRSKFYINRIPQITFLKAIATIMILVCHFVQIFNLDSDTFLLTQFLQIGCQLFFILSCFSLCISYSRKQPTYISFIKRRIMKIIYGYWIILLIYVVLGCLC